MTNETTFKNLEKTSQNSVGTIPLLSEKEVINESKNINEEKEYNDLLKGLQTEMRLRGLSKQTSKMYMFYNYKFLEFIQKFPKDVTEEDIKDFLGYKLSEEISNGSISLIKASLKFYYADVLGKNINLIKTPKILKKLPVVLSKKEVKQLLEKTENIKHRLLIELLYSTGLRLSELINLKYSNLELHENTGWVRMGKGGKDRIFIISEKFKKDLIDYQKNQKKGKESSYIFEVRGRKMSPRGVQHAIKISAKRAGIQKNVHVHSLRHTYATHLLENGVDIRKIQQLLGHTNLQTTQIYTQVSSEEIKKIKSPLDELNL